jgi:hypothetical protein
MPSPTVFELHVKNAGTRIISAREREWLWSDNANRMDARREWYGRERELYRCGTQIVETRLAASNGLNTKLDGAASSLRISDGLNLSANESLYLCQQDSTLQPILSNAVATVRQTLRRMFRAMVAETAKKRRKLVLSPVLDVLAI